MDSFSKRLTSKFRYRMFTELWRQMNRIFFKVLHSNLWTGTLPAGSCFDLCGRYVTKKYVRSLRRLTQNVDVKVTWTSTSTLEIKPICRDINIKVQSQVRTLVFETYQPTLSNTWNLWHSKFQWILNKTLLRCNHLARNKRTSDVVHQSFLLSFLAQPMN